MSLVSGLMNQTIDEIHEVSIDRASDKTRTLVYSDVECRWDERITLLTSAEAKVKQSSVEVWLPPDYDDIKEDWEITKENTKYMVVGKATKYDLNGIKDHIKLYLA